MVKLTIYRILLGFDQLLNVFLLGFPDESISGRTGRAMATGRPKWFVPRLYRFLNWLFAKFGDDLHCENAVEYEENFNKRIEVWRWYAE
jgi:hypothetical protein